MSLAGFTASLYQLIPEGSMLNTIPEGAIALEQAELDQIVGGNFWKTLAAAAAFGFTVGRWLACAFQCVAFDS